MLFLKFGDEVKIVNPNHYDFGFEGIITEMCQDADEQIRYKIFKDYDIGGKEAWAYADEIVLINEPKMTKVEIDKNGFRLGENLFEFNKNGIAIKPFRDIGEDAPDAVRYFAKRKIETATEYEPYDYLKEKGEKDNMEILTIYEDRKVMEINEKYNNKFKEIKNEDAFASIRLSFIKQFEDLYKNEYNKEYTGASVVSSVARDVLTIETEEKIDMAEDQRRTELEELDELLQEVKAQLEIAKDYDTQIKILKRYDILGKDGKINA